MSHDFGIGVCTDCGNLMINTKTGAVCSSGCGKVKTALPRSVNVVNAARLAGVRTAVRIHDRYVIPGVDGSFKPGKKITRTLSSLPKTPTAIVDGEVREMEKDER